ncbi:unnamed protein product [Didymodactylos carnosus]|uniref:Neuroendocrine protein 7B2 n=1 Tax=Didymodactylos carnosus TaxID=1234261 RepID=A0A813RB38_9BILA|nr:unnamed protein product [Didymodactylos carnosus]CAF0830622.1 unnamed protein product [Didymodactylos carnosus]CAF3564370.1 unnamed protein product [Didymodactylos carnosus]CAF3615106.1 unnamed protein product [Didymodactylos carnosus]
MIWEHQLQKVEKVNRIDIPPSLKTNGGAGEGSQHLSPSGIIPNHPEVKTDEQLPLYCDPPNPCPLGFGADDCDASSMEKFTAEYSRHYQSSQDCECDDDHNECSTNNNIVVGYALPTNGILKRSRRIRRDIRRKQQQKHQNNTKPTNPYKDGQHLYFHVAKKSPMY